MKSTLRPYHQLIIIAIILLVHGSMLMTFVIIQFQSHTLNMPTQEALVTIEQEQQPDGQDSSLPNFVSITQGVTNSESLNQQSHEEDTKEIDQQSNNTDQPKQEIEESKLDEAINLATHILDASTLKNLNTIHEKKEAELSNDHSSSATKKIPTLAQLAKGFEEHLQQADFGVISDNKGVASIEQIKYLNYFNKIRESIQAALKNNRHLEPTSPPPNRLLAHMTIDSNGHIAQLRIQESSKDSHFDEFCINCIKDGSSSFPPLPKCLGTIFICPPLLFDPYAPPTNKKYLRFVRG